MLYFYFKKNTCNIVISHIHRPQVREKNFSQPEVEIR